MKHEEIDIGKLAESALTEFEKHHNPFYPNEMRWSRTSLLHVCIYAVKAGIQSLPCGEFSEEDKSRLAEIKAKYHREISTASDLIDLIQALETEIQIKKTVIQALKDDRTRKEVGNDT